MTEAEQLPGFGRLLWLLFMQPVTLHRVLQTSGIDPAASGWSLWKGGRGPHRTYLLRMAVILTTVTPAAAALLSSALAALGLDFSLEKVFVGVAVGVALGVASGIAGGVAFSVAVGVAWGVPFGVALGVAVGVAWGAARGVAWGVAGVTAGVAWGVVMGVVVGVAVGVAAGVAAGVAWGVVMGVAAIMAYFRVPLFFAEVPLQNFLFVLEKFSGTTTLQLAPVFYHELSYIPHPFLQAHLLLTAERDPALVHRALDACAVAPGQRGIGHRVLSRLQARELARAARERQFSLVVELAGEWLSGREVADPLLLGFAETARYLASAQTTSLPYHRLQKLEQARKELHGLRGQLRSKSFLARTLATEAFSLWQQVTEDLLHEAELAAAHQIPNPFRAGEPLSPEEGRETFRGREDLIRSIEALLGEPGRGCSIAFLGPRRCGKTSLLKMLPLMLPDAVCVLFDLQDNPIDSPGSFFSALERRAREQVRRDRQLDLPRLPEGSPFEAGSQWFESLDEWAGDRRILLCLDEFERLESLFPGSQRELLQLLGLLRGTIQHRRRIRILVSGAAPFDELDALWNDHLINAREVRIGHLGESTTLELLRKPIPEFPDEAVPEGVAKAIFGRTGGQPYLVQLYGSILISRLNSEDRRQADLEDVPRVEEEVLQQATYYFRNTFQMAPPQAKESLLALAFERDPKLDSATRRWLRRRLLLTDPDRLSVPVLGTWLREEEAS